MQEIIRNKGRIMLRFDPGEEAIEGIVTYCEENQIKAAAFGIIGACSFVQLSYYNLDTQEYEDREFKENLEVLAGWGNIGTLKHKAMAHVHCSFSNRDFQVVGGHVKKLVVSATLEVTIFEFEGEIMRKHDSFTGLNLMSI